MNSYMEHNRFFSRLTLLFRNVIFTILHPGIVAGLIPFWIIGGKMNNLFDGSVKTHQFTGIFLFITGFIIMTWCIINFAIKGKGTLSPLDPTKKLVISGLYRFSRNPMYIGVMFLLIGETVFFSSLSLCIYSFFVFVGFNIFIIAKEEPRLKKDFGVDYDDYRKKVRRWI
jgi:Putative protein-S-isoprenylcysteine methyltransferase